MGWRYDFEEKLGLVYIVERYSENCIARLDANDWIFESKQEAIETIEMILKDLKGKK